MYRPQKPYVLNYINLVNAVVNHQLKHAGSRLYNLGVLSSQFDLLIDNKPIFITEDSSLF